MIKDYYITKGKKKIRKWMCSFRVDKVNPKTGRKIQIKREGFDTRKEAEEFERQKRNEFDKHGFIENSKENFASYIDRWFDEQFKPTLSKSRSKNRRYIIDKHFIIENDFADKPLADISTYDVDTFFTHKINSEYSSSYIRDMHKLLNLAFDQAVRWKLIKENPVAKVNTNPVKHREMKIWDTEEMNIFLDAAKEERLYIFFLLAITTGARRGELLGLKWSDIDPIEGNMRIQRSLTRKEGIGLEIGPTKSKSGNRTIGISKEVLDELRQHKLDQDTWKHSIKDEYQDHDLVVCTPLGKPMDPRNTNRVMERIIKKSGVKRIRLHDMRHTHASFLIAEGVNHVEAAGRLGHADPSVTLSVYSHRTNKEDKTGDVFQEALNRGKPQKI